MTLKPEGGQYVKDSLIKGNADDKWVHRYQTAVIDNLAYGLKEIYYRAAYNNEEDGDGRTGGIRQFIVTSYYTVNAQHLTANTELTVKVPWLVLLPTLLTPNGDYLSGGRNDSHSGNHYGPIYDFDPYQNFTGVSHYFNGYAVDCNHWGDPAVITVLQNIAEIFNTDYQERLYLNDIGLVYGGKFDVAGTWEGFHTSHQDGKSVDFNPQNLNKNSPVQAWQNWRKKLQDVADSYLEIYRYNDPHDNKQYQLAADVELHISDNYPPIIHADFTRTEVEE